MKISVPKEAMLVFFVIVVGSLIVYIIYQFYPKPTNTYNFFGMKLPFRTDLYKANAIPVYPDNETVYDMLWGIQLENITMVWVNSSDNNMVAVEAFEITYKDRKSVV